VPRGHAPGHRGAMLLVLVALACGWGPAPASPTAGPASPASAEPTPGSPGAVSTPPAASAAPQPDPPAWWEPLYEPVRIPPAALRRVELGSGATAPAPRDIAVRAGRVYFTALDAAHSGAVWVTDLAAGTTAKLVEAPDREFVSLDLSADQLVWSEAWHEDAASVLKTTRWQVRALALSDLSATPTVLASGGLARDGTVLSVVRAGGSEVVLALADRSGAWTFRVLDARDGHPVRTVAASAPAYYMVDVAGGRLVWTQGESNPNGAFCKSELMLSVGSAPRPLASGAVVVSAGGDVVAWLSDPTSSAQCSGLMEHPRSMYGSLTGTWAPTAAGSPADGSPNLGDTDQQTNGAQVSWTEKRDYGASPSGASRSDVVTVLRGVRSGRTYELLDSRGAFAGTALGSDWVAWVRYRDDDTYAIEGASLADAVPAE
jgi:hypothetical protein